MSLTGSLKVLGIKERSTQKIHMVRKPALSVNLRTLIACDMYHGARGNLSYLCLCDLSHLCCA